MLIQIITENYPVAYKPYYDIQIADFLRAGHDVQVYAGSRLDRTEHGKYAQFRLDRLTRYYPITLRTLPRRLPSVVAGAIRWRRRLGELSRELPGTGKTKVLNWGRAVTLHGTPEFVLIHGLGAAVLFPWLKKLFRDVPVGLYYHGGEVPSVKQLSPRAAQDAFNGVDLVFTNTEFSAKEACDRGANRERVFVLPVGFDLDEFPPGSPDRDRRGGTFRMISAGRLSEEKGFLHALEAVHRLANRGIKNFSYKIVGDGYLRPELERFVAENDLRGNVSFMGAVPHEVLVEELAAADVFVLPSIPLGNWQETQACVLQESLLCGTPLVTTRIGGVPESIPPEMLPYCVEPGNSEALAAAMERMLVLPDAERQRLVEVGRRFGERYDIARLNEEMLRIAGVF